MTFCKAMNKIEEYKKEKAGLDILDDIPRYAAEGWEKITDGDKERLKWAGIFFRRQTPGRFMMRLRFANGLMNAAQLRTIGEISRDFGKGFADITTRQQMQLREFKIDDVPEIWRRLHAVDLISLQTGMDNIRGVIGCPVAGLTPNELFDASRVARQFTELFIGNRAFHRPAAQIQRDDHRLQRSLHPCRSAGFGVDAGVKGNQRRPGERFQRCGRRQARLRRLSDRVAVGPILSPQTKRRRFVLISS